jgi:hypothetical protein
MLGKSDHFYWLSHDSHEGCGVLRLWSLESQVHNHHVKQRKHRFGSESARMHMVLATEQLTHDVNSAAHS